MRLNILALQALQRINKYIELIFIINKMEESLHAIAKDLYMDRLHMPPKNETWQTLFSFSVDDV